ncbi:MAG TPA: protein kinase [Thermoanaerobaculia bacterium]|nr:protein kinase [Thermoanaerobaculia bacterium]
MSLASGTRLGSYEILSPLGAGGMGEVYRAKDTKLHRDVAIKVLPESLAADPERLARFEREARVLASLNHPNIAGIHGVEDSTNAKALVLELVEGPTLQDRIEAGPVPVEETLPIARQIAEALEAAHDKGIVHRDLKPANIKIDGAGNVKVLDFGLAKALDPAAGSSSPDLSHSPTLSIGTQAGMILGTAAYMSPEQARGKTADRRADIWAFGVVLWEMLTGGRLFAGETVSDTLAAVLRQEIDWSALPAGTPPAVRRLLARCLERDPRNRLHDAADARIELDEAGEPEPAAAGRAAPEPPRRRAARLPWGIAAAAVAAAAFAVWKSRAPRPEIARLSISLPAGVRLDADTPNQAQIVAISPDGNVVVFRGRSKDAAMLYRRPIGGDEAQPIRGTDDGFDPAFSPDGESLVFCGGGKLRRIAVGGGTPVDLAEDAGCRGTAWGADGTIVFSPTVNSGLWTVPAAGGSPKPLTTLDDAAGERTHRWPQISPDGKTVFFTVGTRDKPGDYDDARIDAVTIGGRDRRVVYRGASFLRCLGHDEYLLGRAGDLLRAHAAEGAEIRDAPVPVIRGIGGDPRSGVVFVAVARNGTLAAIFGLSMRATDEIAAIDRTGKVSPTAIPPGQYDSLALSPDGRRLAIAEGPGGGRNTNIWIVDIGDGNALQLTSDGKAGSSRWAPDGKSLVYSPTAGDALFRTAADGRGVRETLCQFTDSVPISVDSFDPAGATLLVTRYGLTGHRADVDAITMSGSHAVTPFLATEAPEMNAVISPDGRWVAYTGEYERGQQVYVQAYPTLSGRWQVSRDGGFRPRWSADGTELFYLSGYTMTAVPVRTSPTFSYGDGRPLFTIENPGGSEYTNNYEVAPDGKRFYIIRKKTSSADAAARIDVILHGTEGLKDLAR